MLKPIMMVLAASFFAANAYADQTETVKDIIQSTLSKSFPEFKVQAIEPTVIDGLYQVSSGPMLLYVSADGRYVVNGDIFDITANNTNLSEQARQQARVKSLAAIPDAEYVSYPAQGETKHVLTVFTDIDCGYCRKFHQEVSTLTANGVSVRYLGFPRSGVDTPSYNKLVTVWCSESPADAMTKAKSGETLSAISCENPINRQFELGAMSGVQGTPSLILEDGRLIPGYLTANQLLEMLNKS